MRRRGGEKEEEKEENKKEKMEEEKEGKEEKEKKKHKEEEEEETERGSNCYCFVFSFNENKAVKAPTFRPTIKSTNKLTLGHGTAYGLPATRYAAVSSSGQSATGNDRYADHPSIRQT